MQYNRDAADGVIFAPGEYEASVKKAIESVSKAMHPMIEMIVTIYGADGAMTDVFDYLSSIDSAQWKVKHFCESAGLDYARGNLEAEECVDRNVRVNLEIDDNKQYGKKNKISDYLLRGADVAPSKRGADDDIPF